MKDLYTTEAGADALGNSKRGAAHTPLAGIVKRLPLRVLSTEDFRFWQHHGYLVVKSVISPEQAERTARFVWEFQELDPTDPAGWFAPQRRSIEMAELNNSGMVEAYNNQRLWDNRTAQRMYDLFVDIWDNEKLWVSIDRANLNPPNRHGREFQGFMHWDVDSSIVPRPVGVQGVLALSKTDSEVGGFQCVPELFYSFDEWLKTQPADRDRFKPDMTELEATQVNMEPGDMLVFNSLLAHGIRPNLSHDRARLAQYISMSPAEEDNETLRQWRVHCWREREVPQGYAFPGDPRGWEKTRYPRAELSALGQKLLGLERW
ncbi:phytanoyl-CoA dioxygenase family protein [Paraburkholderia bryophila]|uniref:Ectoine hydroxylase-related dioxygenase (Phytanoyl-CoA dioxygenase family) n=1 Tax=Paraburkholderia bryophila TaxID=420952 RepID=A0A7Y9W6S5_9BURK|nr:phytanoyl-CoA dioxygenase family protein [Paraburkholderia bryophila]NYH15269.1 ectoine hydroxylase-related dioxygenase (phytanoyl-CoA dioxygenase family) [Paraburkholderia bryophila]